jgi:long-chain acyl-CoA synthetase
VITETQITTLVDALEATLERRAEAAAVVWGERSSTYAELADRSRRIAAGLVAEGLKPGDRIAIWASNTGEFVEFYLAAAIGGFIAVPINFRFTPPEADHVLHDAGPRAILVAAPHLGTLAATRWWTASHDAALVIVLEGELVGRLDDGQDDHGVERRYETWLQEQDPAAVPDRRASPDEVFFIGYTSGTTGFPKGAMVAQGPMLDNTRVLIAELGDLGPHDRFLTLMPLFHSNSTWFAVGCVLIGATNIVAPSGGLDGRRIIELAERHGATATSVVPTILQMMLEGHRELGHSGSTLRSLLSGSAPLSAALKRRVIDTFDAELFEGYGATETGIVTSLGPSEQLQRLRSIGRAAPGKEIELRDPEGNVVPTGEIGELWCRGTGVLLTEYRGNPEATAKARDADGWHTVGDMARVDEDGYYELVDRKNDMIISGGENVYPTEVEEALLQHPAVREIAVIGVPDEHWGERVHAVIVPTEGAEPDPEPILAAAAGHLARFKLPRSIEFVLELPRTPTGKIQRRRVRDRVVAVQEDGGEAHVPGRD